MEKSRQLDMFKYLDTPKPTTGCIADEILDELGKLGRRECTYAYDYGCFVIDDLNDFDQFMKKYRTKLEILKCVC